MKLKCKCGKFLTHEMAHSKYIIKSDSKMTTGYFKLLKGKPSYNNKWSDNEPAQVIKALPKRIMVPEGSIMDGVVPHFREGHGCCNYHGGDLKCSCGNVLGWMDLDCWQLGSVDFYEKAVVRVYD